MEKNTTPQSPKLSVTPAADKLLTESLEKVNTGFLGGKITKLDLASWTISHALEDFNDAKVEKIRKAFFNELTFLESIVKLSRQNGQDKLPADQYAKLQELFGKSDKSKPKAQRDLSFSESS